MPDESSSELRRRITAFWQLKLLLLIGLTILFSAPYIYFAHHPWFPIRHLPVTWLDRVSGFDPRWVWVYQSVYLLTGLLPWMANRREQLRRYVFGFLLLAGVSFAIFIFFPTRISRPPVADAQGMYALLLFYDGELNAFPSLHVGFMYYTLAFTRRVYPEIPKPVMALLIVWGLLIGWSTLSTKEHYAVDVFAGLFLGILADLAAWRWRVRARGAQT